LFALKQIAGSSQGVTISWRSRVKPQPAATTFKIPPIDAPNVRGARDLGFDVGSAAGDADLSTLRDAVDTGRVKVLYVLDPGPDGSIGDTDWIVAARQAGRIDTLIVQGVLKTNLAHAADIVLPGAAWVEKDATYTNMTGHVQAAARVIQPPGDAGEDWQILMKLGPVFGVNVTYASGVAVREAIAASLSSLPGYAALPAMTFARPVAARDWLQASNPSERWKWDFMFQDLPPVKFGDEFGPLPRAEVIPLREVE
jgi:NADH-quinone oxidoreductase subunit G